MWAYPLDSQGAPHTALAATRTRPRQQEEIGTRQKTKSLKMEGAKKDHMGNAEMVKQ